MAFGLMTISNKSDKNTCVKYHKVIFYAMIMIFEIN